MLNPMLFELSTSAAKSIPDIPLIQIINSETFIEEYCLELHCILH